MSPHHTQKVKNETQPNHLSPHPSHPQTQDKHNNELPSPKLKNKRGFGVRSGIFTHKKGIFRWQNFKRIVFFHKIGGKFVKLYYFLNNVFFDQKIQNMGSKWHIWNFWSKNSTNMESLGDKAEWAETGGIKSLT